MAGCIFFNKVWQWRFWIYWILGIVSHVSSVLSSVSLSVALILHLHLLLYFLFVLLQNRSFAPVSSLFPFSTPALCASACLCLSLAEDYAGVQFQFQPVLRILHQPAAAVSSRATQRSYRGQKCICVRVCVCVWRRQACVCVCMCTSIVCAEMYNAWYFFLSASSPGLCVFMLR